MVVASLGKEKRTKGREMFGGEGRTSRSHDSKGRGEWPWSLGCSQPAVRGETRDEQPVEAPLVLH